MEGPDGKMVPEMPDHGLKTVPSNLNSLADVQTESYSNNLGFYKMAFPIIPHSPSSLGVSPGNRPMPAEIGKIRLSTTQAALNQPIKLSASLAAPTASVQGVTAEFYDGDPKTSGVLFDIERLSYLQPNEARDATTIYRPSSCGMHALFVVVNKSTPNEVVRRAQPVRVDCKAKE